MPFSRPPPSPYSSESYSSDEQSNEADPDYSSALEAQFQRRRIPPPRRRRTSSYYRDSLAEEYMGAHICKWFITSHGIKTTCGAAFPDPRTLQEHLIRHLTTTVDGAKGIGYYCCWEGCHRPDEPFSQKSKLQDHFLTHSNFKNFGCPVCRKWFARKATLDRHKRSHFDWINPDSDKPSRNFAKYHPIRPMRTRRSPGGFSETSSPSDVQASPPSGNDSDVILGPRGDRDGSDAWPPTDIDSELSSHGSMIEYPRRRVPPAVQNDAIESPPAPPTVQNDVIESNKDDRSLHQAVQSPAPSIGTTGSSIVIRPTISEDLSMEDRDQSAKLRFLQRKLDSRGLDLRLA